MSAPLFVYRVEYSAAVDAFVALCLATTTLGYHAVRKRPRAAPVDSGDPAREILLARVVSVLGILGCLLQLGRRGGGRHAAQRRVPAAEPDRHPRHGVRPGRASRAPRRWASSTATWPRSRSSA